MHLQYKASTKHHGMFLEATQTRGRAAHQRGVAGVVAVDGTGGGGVHVAEQTLDLPQGNASSSVRHLADQKQSRAVKVPPYVYDRILNKKVIPTRCAISLSSTSYS